MFPSSILVQLHEPIAEELRDAFDRVLTASVFIGGGEVRTFEEEFAAAHGRRHAVGCASGTDALALALHAAGIGPGDEVIVPAMTFVATAEAVVHVGATPVVADVDPESLLLSEDTVGAVRTARTRALIPVHLYGHVVPFDLLSTWAADGLIVVEDAAQAHLATWKGDPVGTVGVAACFSSTPERTSAPSGMPARWCWTTMTSRRPCASAATTVAPTSTCTTRSGWPRAWTAFRRRCSAVKRGSFPHGRNGDGLWPNATERSCHRAECASSPGRKARFTIFCASESRPNDVTRCGSGLRAKALVAGSTTRSTSRASPRLARLRSGALSGRRRSGWRAVSLPMGPTLSDADVDRVCERVRSFAARVLAVVRQRLEPRRSVASRPREHLFVLPVAGSRGRVILNQAYAAQADLDWLGWVIGLTVGALLRVDFDLARLELWGQIAILPVVLVCQLVAGGITGLYLGRWQRGSFEEVAAGREDGHHHHRRPAGHRRLRHGSADGATRARWSAERSSPSCSCAARATGFASGRSGAADPMEERPSESSWSEGARQADS